MPISTIAILYPGAMGASLAHVLSLRLPHLRLLTSLSHRSPSTIARAAASGLVDIPMEQAVQEADVILSVLPPSEAVKLAKEVAGHLGEKKPVYIEANAVSPETVAHISSIFQPHNIPFLDGSIIGFPATNNLSSIPKLYLSSKPEWGDKLREVADVLSGGGVGKGLRVKVMEDAGEGGASALKMCYGGINKGATGLAALLVLSARAHSPGTAKALLDEMVESQPAFTQKLVKGLPDMVPKAYRWVGEMEEISAFITASIIDTPSASQHTNPADTFQGLAQAFQRIADDLKEKEAVEKKDEELKGLLDWAEEGKSELERRHPK
ncbi:hypothetical protein L202_03633 [Cryptococcus amylolentus CBS 6039]|uniref:Phosphogluconate dehydrogenase NAD-binding putative C-terminal domain-containing protein n=1 Tax=Cryptococcus amylolentus CBS 6039 TaxID=1295533 RepID=A0A1E3HTN6_9TREE|nr:hypothetical protein L202_03633 [Cryptococcus amylolentus CBS 6039]ODN79709.1 hypothetical protein L202_03633 [Cryptococcus amylolentus CBS 6039]